MPQPPLNILYTDPPLRGDPSTHGHPRFRHFLRGNAEEQLELKRFNKQTMPRGTACNPRHHPVGGRCHSDGCGQPCSSSSNRRWTRPPPSALVAASDYGARPRARGTEQGWGLPQGVRASYGQPRPRHAGHELRADVWEPMVVRDAPSRRGPRSLNTRASRSCRPESITKGASAPDSWE